MKNALAAPLRQSQIDAACELSDNLAGWQRTDACLTLMQRQVPGFSSDAILLKCVTVNTLYGTSIRAIMPVADRVFHVLKTTDTDSAGPELVEKLAKVRFERGQKTWRLNSFASKFAHRFIDPDRFPILDYFAERAVKRHLKKLAVTIPNRRYVTFARNVQRLRELADITCGGEEFDRYLFLRGAYDVWKKKLKKPVAADLIKLFKQTQGRNGRLVDILVGAEK